MGGAKVKSRARLIEIWPLLEAHRDGKQLEFYWSGAWMLANDDVNVTHMMENPWAWRIAREHNEEILQS